MKISLKALHRYNILCHNWYKDIKITSIIKYIEPVNNKKRITVIIKASEP